MKTDEKLVEVTQADVTDFDFDFARSVCPMWEMLSCEAQDEVALAATKYRLAALTDRQGDSTLLLRVEDAVAEHGSIIVEPMGEGLGWAATDSNTEDRIWTALATPTEATPSADDAGLKEPVRDYEPAAERVLVAAYTTPTASGAELAELEAVLSAFVNQQHEPFGSDPPEDNEEWRAGFRSACAYLREELRPWWPFAKPLSLAHLRQSPAGGVEALRERGTALVNACDQMIEDTDPIFAEMQIVRGRSYEGKQIREELEAFRAALKDATP